MKNFFHFLCHTYDVKSEFFLPALPSPAQPCPALPSAGQGWAGLGRAGQGKDNFFQRIFHFLCHTYDVKSEFFQIEFFTFYVICMT